MAYERDESDLEGVKQEPIENPTLDERRKLAKEVEEYFQYYTTQLKPYFRTSLRQRRIYHNQLKDRRLPHEKWRAFTPEPYMWSSVKSMASSFNELIFAIDPPIQAAGIGAGEEDLAHKFNRLFDYVFRKTGFRAQVKRSFEDAMIDGTKIRKNTLVTKARDVIYFPTDDVIQQFQEQVAAIVAEGMQMPDFNDPVAFEAWRQQAMEAGTIIPPMPIPGPRRIERYKGPGFLDINLFDMRFDPHLAPSEQVCVIQRVVKPLEWVKDRAGKDKLFDAEAVGEAESGASGEDEFDEYEQEIADMLGIQVQSHNNPRLKKPVELWEAWMPGNKQSSYRMVMNRNIVINNNLRNPYAHGDHPYIFIRNHPSEGKSVGIQEFRNVERLLYELNTLRGLRLDAVLLSVLPIFIKARDAGLGDRLRQLTPGMFLDTSRPDAVRALDKVQVDPAVFREMAEIRSDIDQAVGSLPVIRGQTAQPRVAALSTEKAFNSTLARIKDRVIEFESELNPFVENSLYIMYQFMGAEWRIRAGGSPDADPFIKYTPEEFLTALEMDYAFRGATSAINRELEQQTLREWFTVLVNAQIPEFKSADMAKFITDQITRHRSDQFFRTEEEMQQMAQQQQEQQPPEGEQAPDEGAQAQPASPPAA